MTFTLTEQVAQKIIKKLIGGEDYRVEVIALINAQFLQYIFAVQMVSTFYPFKQVNVFTNR